MVSYSSGEYENVMRDNARYLKLPNRLLTAKINIIRDFSFEVEETVVIGQLAPTDVAARPQEYLYEVSGTCRRVSPFIYLYMEETPYGYVCKDGVYYCPKPDLRACLGWLLTTTYGRETQLRVNLDKMAGQLKTLVENNKKYNEGKKEIDILRDFFGQFKVGFPLMGFSFTLAAKVVAESMEKK